MKFRRHFFRSLLVPALFSIALSPRVAATADAVTTPQASPAAPAPAAPAPTAPAADKAFEQLQQVLQAPNTIAADRAHWQKMSEAEHRAVTSAESTLVAFLSERFVETYPTDPRRWQAVSYLSFSRRTFTGPTADADQAAWNGKVENLKAQLLAAADAPPELKARLLERNVYAQLGSMNIEAIPDKKPDFAAAAAVLAQMAAVAPGFRIGGAVPSSIIWSFWNGTIPQPPRRTCISWRRMKRPTLAWPRWPAE